MHFGFNFHPQTSFVFDRLEKFLPPQMKVNVNTGENGGDPAEAVLYGLVCQDPDGEAHCYAMDENGKKTLLKILTGVEVASPGELRSLPTPPDARMH